MNNSYKLQIKSFRDKIKKYQSYKFFLNNKDQKFKL